MKEIFVRLDRCLGCKSCEIACAVEHSASKSLFGAVSEKPGRFAGSMWRWRKVKGPNGLPAL